MGERGQNKQIWTNIGKELEELLVWTQESRWWKGYFARLSGNNWQNNKGGILPRYCGYCYLAWNMINGSKIKCYFSSPGIFYKVY